MKLLINGNSEVFPENFTIRQLLNQLELCPDRVVLELNLNILNPTEHRDTVLRDGDKLEIIQFVGGG